MNQTFYPQKRVLMGPGPSDVPERVLEAMSRPTVGHLDPEFSGMMEQLKQMLRDAFLTKNEATLPISGPGSVGMEFCFVNLIESGDEVIVCRNGVFGERMKENVERCGATAILVDDEWGKPVDPQKLRDALQNHKNAKAVALVHAETSTGVCSDMEQISDICREFGVLTILDTVTSLGGMEVNLDKWGIDACYSGSQKCLSCIPGLSPVSLSPRAVDVIRKRKTKVQSWFLDFNLIAGYWQSDSKRTYHHTAPVNSLYALNESLLLLHKEGLQTAWQRHKDMHVFLKQELEKLDFSFLVEEPYRLPQLNAVQLTFPIQEAELRRLLLQNYNIEVGAGLGKFAGKLWRIGIMGASANKNNILLLVNALKELLNQ